MNSRIKDIFVDTYATRHIDQPFVVCTHDGVFHTDELMAVAILKLYIEFNKCTLEIVRSRNDVSMDSADLVFDEGMMNEGKYFDHHQPLDEYHNDDNVPLASAGLVWKDLGYHLIKHVIRHMEFENIDDTAVLSIWNKIDTKLITPIDAADNGVNLYKDYKNRPVDLSTVITMFNHYQSDIQNKQFYKALKLMCSILHNFIISMIKQIYGEKQLLDLINTSENKYNNICIIPKYINNWKDIVNEHFDQFEKFKLLLYPSDTEIDDRGEQTWRITSFPKYKHDGFSIRCPAPLEWLSLKGDELKRISKHNCLTFVHKNGFMGGLYGTKQDAIKVCNDWISNSSN